MNAKLQTSHRLHPATLRENAMTAKKTKPPKKPKVKRPRY